MNGFDAKYWMNFAPEWAKYVAMDENGDVWAYENQPYIDGNQWYSKGRMEIILHKVPTWRDTLTSRSDLLEESGL